MTKDEEIRSIIEATIDDIEHYGVKGMKWGVRKDRDGGGRRKSTFKERYDTARNTKNLRAVTTRSKKNGKDVTIKELPNAALPSFVGALLGDKPANKVQQSKVKSFNLEVDGKSVGDASIEFKDDGELNLVWLGVDKNQRGQGYGQAVFNNATELGRQSGAKKLTLEVPGNAPDALHIYEKAGFKKGETLGEPDDYWGGLTVMSYDINEVKHALSDVTSDELEFAFQKSFPDTYKERESLDHTDLNEYLAHYGVKGMKWGVRKDRQGKKRGKLRRGATKTFAAIDSADKAITKEQDKQIFTSKNANSKARTATIARTLVEAKKLNNDPKFKGKDLKADPALEKEYSSKLKKLAKDIYIEEYSEVDPGLVSRFLETTELDKDVLNFNPNRARHSDENGELRIKLIRNRLGHVVDIKDLTEESLDHTDLNEYLAHYGVKGMKWGVRRSQAALDRAAGRKTRKATKASSKAKDTRTKSGRKTASTNRRQLSDNDISSLVKRLESEKKLKTLVDQDVSPGRTFAKTIMTDSGKRALTTMATGTMLYGAKYAFDREFDAKEFGKVISRGGFNKKK